MLVIKNSRCRNISTLFTLFRLLIIKKRIPKLEFGKVKITRLVRNDESKQTEIRIPEQEKGALDRKK